MCPPMLSNYVQLPSQDASVLSQLPLAASFVVSSFQLLPFHGVSVLLVFLLPAFYVISSLQHLLLQIFSVLSVPLLAFSSVVSSDVVPLSPGVLFPSEVVFLSKDLVDA